MFQLTSYGSLLTQLVQAESTDRAMRSIRYQMHVARFPIHHDLAGFDFEQSKVDRRQISTFATTIFTDKAENIVLIGGTSTGKTHLATALGIEAVTRHGKRVRFYSTVELVNTLEQENAPAHSLFARIHVARNTGIEVPRSFADYVVRIDEEGMPAGVALHRKMH